MKAVDLINEFFTETGLEKVDDVSVLVRWLEAKTGKRMNRPLIFSKGCGGGQTYRVFWNTFDSEGNRNKPSYYFVCKGARIGRLDRNYHLPLQHWIDAPAPTVVT